MLSSISSPFYTVRFPKYWLVRDEPADKFYSFKEVKSDYERMIFHVSAGDYMSTLASILRFFEESISENNITPEMRELQLQTIRKVIQELLYLDKHYAITPKD